MLKQIDIAGAEAEKRKIEVFVLIDNNFDENKLYSLGWSINRREGNLLELRGNINTFVSLTALSGIKAMGRLREVIY